MKLYSIKIDCMESRKELYVSNSIIDFFKESSYIRGVHEIELFNESIPEFIIDFINGDGSDLISIPSPLYNVISYYESWVKKI